MLSCGLRTGSQAMSRNPTRPFDDTFDADLDPGRSIVIVPRDNQEMLSEKQQVDYHDYREKFLNWLLHFGKNPDRANGYSPSTVYGTGYRAAATTILGLFISATHTNLRGNIT